MPFVVAVSKGLKLKLIGVAVSYAEADNCVVSKASGITKANAKQLEGKKVGTPIGNVTHYKLLRTLDHLGVDASKGEDGADERCRCRRCLCPGRHRHGLRLRLDRCCV